VTKAAEIRDCVHRTLASLQRKEFASSVQEAKRVIERITTTLLRANAVTTEEYRASGNRHVEWPLEKKIKECEARNLLPSDMCAELLLIKDWRNDLEHVIGELGGKVVANYSIDVVRRLYAHTSATLSLLDIVHWPEFLETGRGNMLPFEAKGVTAKDGQVSIESADGQRVVIDFSNDAAVWVDEKGNKKYYKGNIAEGNNGKGWIG